MTRIPVADSAASPIPARPVISSSQIWALAWPQMLMMLFHFMIGFVDVWVAGRLGPAVQGALGMITQLTFFFLVVAIAVANGAVAAISQSIGAGRLGRAQRYVALVLELGLATSGIILVVGLLIHEPLLDLLQVPGELRPVTSYLLRVYLYILPCYYLLNISNAVFRAQKLVFYPLYAMILTMTVNTVGDLGLGLGWFGIPKLGYAGLAWSTFASVAAGTLLNLVVLLRRRMIRKDALPSMRWIRRGLPYLFKVAWPGGVMQVVWQSAYMILFAITASLPVGNVTALAGMTAGLRIESLLFLPGFAFNLTAGILVGQMLGAGDFQAARAYGYRIWLMGVGSISLLTLAVWLVIDPVTAFVAPDPDVQAQSINYLRFNMLAIPFTLTSQILAGALNGAGATLYNLASFGIGSWLVRLPLAYLLGHVVLGNATGVWVAMLASQVFQSLLTLYLYARRDWSRFAMRKIAKPVTEGHDVRLHPRQP